MEAITYSYARQNLAKTMSRICDEHELVIITRKVAEPVVMMSLQDYNSIQETAYLLKSSANAEKLRKSIKQYEQGKYKKQEIFE